MWHRRVVYRCARETELICTTRSFHTKAERTVVLTYLHVFHPSIDPPTDRSCEAKPYSLLWNMLSHCELQCTTSNWASSPRLLEVWELLWRGWMDLFLIWHVWQFVQQASTKWKSKVWCPRPHACGGAKLLIRNNTASPERLQPPQMVDWPCRFANLILRADMSIYLRRRNTELYMDELKCGPVTQHWHLNVQYMHCM